MIVKQAVFIILLSLLFTNSNASHAFETLGKQAILMDATTNTVLFSKNADELMTPSSMS